MIQASKPEPRITRYELTDHEWAVIKPMLPNTFVVAEIERFDYFVP